MKHTDRFTATARSLLLSAGLLIIIFWAADDGRWPRLITTSEAGQQPMPGAAVTAATVVGRSSAVEQPAQAVPSVGAGWNQLGGNPQRTYYAAANLPARSGALNNDWRVLWIWNGPNGDSGPVSGHLSLPDAVAPVVGDGRLYLGHSDGTVRALYATSGSQAWATNVGGAILNSGAYDSASGAVYFASTNGRLYKLRAADGAVQGEFNLGAEVEQAVLLVGETVYAGTRGGKLYAVSTTTMQQRWVYDAGAAITASSAYAGKNGGLIIFPSEDSQVHAVRAGDGTRAWRVPVNSFMRPDVGSRPARYFPDIYAVVAEQADVVIVRSYFDWQKTWNYAAGAPSNQEETRQFLQNNPSYQSLFVLDLDDGGSRFTAPVLGGAIGNGGHYYSSPPEVVVKQLADNSQVAYLLWRNRQACRISTCDGREDTTIGEMDLSTGSIRFVQDHKNEGTIRLPTDEQGALSMVGDVLFHGHWMSLGAIRIPNRTSGGSSYSSPIPSSEYLSVSNTVGTGRCDQRISAQRYCPVGHSSPADGYQLDAGFYIYYASTAAYDQYWHPPVRGPIYDNGVLYWRSNDGAVIALAPNGVGPPPSLTPATAATATRTPTASRTPTGTLATATRTPTASRTPTGTLATATRTPTASRTPTGTLATPTRTASSTPRLTRTPGPATSTIFLPLITQ